MEDGTTFDSGRPGIYKCVYRITPKEGDSYLVARTITVTEKEPETQAAGNSGSEESGDSEDPRPFAGTASSCCGSSGRRGKKGCRSGRDTQ
ncbi:MAG: hypothetical protein ACLS61_06280 [Ruminococcus sp.]